VRFRYVLEGELQGVVWRELTSAGSHMLGPALEGRGDQMVSFEKKDPQCEASLLQGP